MMLSDRYLSGRQLISNLPLCPASLCTRSSSTRTAAQSEMHSFCRRTTYTSPHLSIMSSFVCDSIHIDALPIGRFRRLSSHQVRKVALESRQRYWWIRTAA